MRSRAWPLPLLLLALDLAGCGPRAGGPPVSFTVTVGAEENVIPPGTPGLLFVPDEHLSYLRQADGSYKVWISNGGTVGFTSPDLFALTPMAWAGGVPAQQLAPSGPGTAAFDADYAGSGSVLAAANGADLLLIYHAENHLFGSTHTPGLPFYGGIGLARSTDGGQSWQRQGEIISGQDPQQVTQPSTGAGALTPAAIVSGGHIYVLFREIDLQTGVQGLAIARSPVLADGAPGTWMKFSQGSFSTPGLGGAFTPLPLILDPGAESDRRQPSVSYNSALGAFLLTIVGNGGIYAATSPDLLTWSAGQVILPAPVPDATVTPSTAPYHWYPALISPDQPSEATTGPSGYLYYAKGANDGTSHHTLYRRPFSLLVAR